MDTNYWKEYWDNYYKFMAVYLGGIQEAYPDADMRSEYTEVASLFEPVMPLEEDMNYEPYNNNGQYNNGQYNNGTYNNNGQYNNGPYNNNGQYNNGPYNNNGQYNDEPYNDDPYNNESDNNNSETDEDVNDVEVSTIPFTFPGGGQPFTPGQGQSPQPFISPGGGQFTINNCRRMPIVRIEMRRGFSPSNFFMVVDKTDRRSIQGFRIACEGNRIRFVPMAVEYRNIDRIECAF